MVSHGCPVWAWHNPFCRHRQPRHGHRTLSLSTLAPDLAFLRALAAVFQTALCPYLLRETGPGAQIRRSFGAAYRAMISSKRPATAAASRPGGPPDRKSLPHHPPAPSSSFMPRGAVAGSKGPSRHSRRICVRSCTSRARRDQDLGMGAAPARPHRATGGRPRPCSDRGLPGCARRSRVAGTGR